MSLQFNTAPYFDDFDANKNFYKVLFKPGYAVQARELNQLQSILLHQINGVSGHLFKKNTMIIPGGVSFNNIADIVNIAGNVDPSALVGKTITNAINFDPKDDASLDTFITAVVLGYDSATDELPAALYVKYFKTDSSGRMTFNKSETLKTVDISGQIISFSVHNTHGVSVGKVATASKGLFYTKNLFVDTESQSIIIDRNRDTVTNRIIGFKVVESIVTSNDDESLLDNASGSPNQYAPGADRYKVSLELTSVNIGSTIDEDNFITLMVIENNVVTYINNKTQYAELIKTLARRTYDTNGNFIVNGLNATVNDSVNGDYIWANISKGKCYLGGYEYDQIYNLPLAIEKPRSTLYQETRPLINKFATGLTYFYIAGGSFFKEIPERDSLVQFLDVAPGVNGASVIGYGVFKDIQYSHGSFEDGHDVYRIYFDNIFFEKGYSLSDIGGFTTIVVPQDEQPTDAQGAPILHVLQLSGIVGSMMERITSTDGSDSEQNLLAYSQNFHASPWEKSSITISNEYVPSIDGTISATSIKATANNAEIKQYFTATKDTEYTFSVYIKRKAGSVGGDISISINGDPWVVQTDVNSTSWFRCTINDMFFSTGRKYVGIKLSSINDEIFIYGAQLEPTPSASAYIMTTDQPVLLASRTCRIYNQSGSLYYVIKDSVDRPVPDTATVWSYGGRVGTANRKSTFISNYSPQNVPLIRIDNDTIKTLYTTDGNTFFNSTSYNIARSFVFNISDGTDFSQTTSPLGENEYFDSFSTASFMGFVEREGVGLDQSLDLSGLITVNQGSKTFTITISDENLNNSNVIVVASIIKYNISEAKKIQKSAIIQIAEPSSSYIALKHQDVIRVVKIVHGKAVSIDDVTVQNNEATFTTSSNHNLDINDVVIIKNVKSTSNQNGSFGEYFNNKFIVKSIPVDNGVQQLKKFVVDFAMSDTYTTGGIVHLPANISTDMDITSRFVLDNGQTPFAYGTGFIKLKKGAVAPIGQITINYDYYALEGTANYLSVDSYGDYTENDLSYIGQIPDIKFSDGSLLNVRSFLDFRIRTSNYFFKNVGTYTYSGEGVLTLKDLNLSSLENVLVDKYIVGPGHRSGATITSVRINQNTGDTELILGTGAALSNHTGIFYIGLNTSSLKVVDTSEGAGGASFIFPRDGDVLSYSYTKFLPKQVMVYINRDGDNLSVKYDTVASYNDVLALRRNEFKLPILYIYMKPYTLGIQDISISKFENPVYHMLDIHDIKLRVDRNEYYTSLALNNDIHQQIINAQNEDITDASYGFWNEDFMDMSVQATADNDFACTIYDKSYAAPGTVTRTIRLELVDTLDTDTWQKTGTNITLPYTEMRYIGNQFASTFNNLNPYNVINWVGKMTLTPSVDNWIDVTVLPTSEVASLDVSTKTSPVIIVPPPTVAEPPVILPPPPPPPVHEVVTQVNNLRTSWGKDSRKGYHAITFDWVTNIGRTGRVNTDMHLSSVVNQFGHNGVYARALINRRYADVRPYLQAGTHFDQRPPSSYW